MRVAIRTVVLALVAAFAITALGVAVRGEPNVHVDQVKCQVCDVAVAAYARTALGIDLYCANITAEHAQLGYVVQALAPFALPNLNRDMCAPPRDAEAADGAEMTPEDGAALQQQHTAGAGAGAGADAGDEGVRKAAPRPVALDETMLGELARKTFVCGHFLPAFPAVEVFPGEGKDLTVEELETWPDRPEPVHPKFVAVLKRACELTLAHPKRSLQLAEETLHLVARFPLADAPRTVQGARNHVYKLLLRPLQQAVCASSCDPAMRRPDNFVPLVAYAVDSKPIIQ